MQLGSYEIHPGILVTIGMVIASLLFFIALWRGNKKTGDAMRSIARDQGWAWIGPARRI